MQVSFLIVVRDRLELLQATLASLKATLPPALTHEIVLIDDASAEETRRYLRALPPPHVVLHNERRATWESAINRAARTAQGEIMVLVDPDLTFEPGWLEPLLHAFTSLPRVGLAASVILPAKPDGLAEAGVILEEGGTPGPLPHTLSSLRARGEWATFPLVGRACCALRREWFLRSGGLDEGYHDGGEFDLGMRAREDGLRNVVATRSGVRRPSIAPSSSAYEFRNTERFLARWGERTRALAREFAEAEALSVGATAARHFFSTWPHRLGLGPASVRQRHRTALRRAERARVAATRPVRIGIDLLRMAPGGANGGIKPFIYSLLAEIGRTQGSRFNFVAFAQRSLRDELATVLRPGDFVLEPTADHFNVSCRDPAKGWRHVSRFAASDDIPSRTGLDVLYAVFGVSQFMRLGLPCISFVVDLLHRDLPEALPVEEVNFRHGNFVRLAAGATYIQCNSRHVISALGTHYGVPPVRCFHVYNVVQNRLPAPARSVADPYFFYPANFWPHKNHETLLVAYRQYAESAGSRAWPLVLSGHPDARMKLLEELRDGLGLRDRVRFAGHLDDATFASLWAAATALVFPSLHEGFGIPLLEAMRFGVPIVAAQSTAIPEVAGEAALYVDPRDPRAIADALRRVAIREGLREDLIARGRLRLAAFSLELEAGRLAHFLEAAARRQTP